MNREARRILLGWSTHGAVTARTRVTTENRRKEKDTVGIKKEGSSRLGDCTNNDAVVKKVIPESGYFQGYVLLG